jgi:F-type H+-transporting ATPase subunit b
MAAAMDDYIVIAQLEGEPAGEGALLEEAVLEEEHAEEDNFPPFDPTFFASQLLWLVITFVALYLLMSRLVLPRIGGILEDRRDRIARDLDQADRLKQQADDAIASYERALAEARAGAFTIAAEAREAAKQEANARQAKVEAALDDRLGDAEKRIADVKSKALADVGEIAGEAAEAVVQRLLGKKPTANELKDALKESGAANV